MGDDAGAGTILAGIWAFVNEVCRAMPRSQLDLHHRQRLPRQGVRLDPPGVELIVSGATDAVFGVAFSKIPVILKLLEVFP